MELQDFLAHVGSGARIAGAPSGPRGHRDDPHKRSVTIEVMAPDETVLDGGLVGQR